LTLARCRLDRDSDFDDPMAAGQIAERPGARVEDTIADVHETCRPRRRCISASPSLGQPNPPKADFRAFGLIHLPAIGGAIPFRPRETQLGIHADRWWKVLRTISGVVLLLVGGFGLWGFPAAWGQVLGLLYAMPLFLLGAWAVTCGLVALVGGTDGTVQAEATRSSAVCVATGSKRDPQKSALVGAVLLALGGFGLWGFAAAWGVPLGLLYAIRIFLLGAWSITDAVSTSGEKAA
jgi:hypothetical protein